MMFEVFSGRGRSLEHSMDLKDRAGLPVVLEADDRVRFRVGNNEAELEIDVDDATETASGTTVRIDTRGSGETAATITIVLAEEDTSDLLLACYNVDLSVEKYEEDELQSSTLVDTGTLHVLALAG